MAYVPVEELLKRCGSIYKLSILAAKRAKEVAEGSPPLVETLHKKVTSIALEEIAQGKVLYRPDGPEGGSAKRGRSVKPKEEKKRAT